jgi:hypothetical protein
VKRLQSAILTNIGAHFWGWGDQIVGVLQGGGQAVLRHLSHSSGSTLPPFEPSKNIPNNHWEDAQWTWHSSRAVEGGRACKP